MLCRTLCLCVLLINAFSVAQAQTPPAPKGPPAITAPQDATRPPGREQRQSAPNLPRTNSSDPTAPPSATRPLPQTPPGSANATQTNTPQVTDTLERVSPTPLPGDTSGTTKLDDKPLLDSLPKNVLPPFPTLQRLGVTSTQTLPLSMNEAIRRALENNNDITVARDEVRLAESLLQSYEGVYEPVFQFTPLYSSFVTPQSNSLSGAGQSGTLSQTLFDVNSSVTKLSKTGGGSYQLFFNTTRATTTSSNDLLSPTYAGNLGVTFTQPLWRDRSIDFNRRQIRVQRKRLEQSDIDFRRLNTEIIAQVQRAYWDLAFALHDQQNLLGSLKLIRQQVIQTEQRIEAGSTAPLERAEVQTELSNRELEVLQASEAISIAENNLKRLILRNPRAPEWSVALIPTDNLAFDVESPIVLKQILEEAQANRPELRRLRIQQEIVEIDRGYFQNQTRPRIDINATVSTTGLAGAIANRTTTQPGQIPIISNNATTNADAFLLTQINTLRASQGLPPAVVPLTVQESPTGPANLVGGYPRMLGNLFSFNTRNIVVGLTIQIPFRNKTAKANLATTHIQREQLTALMENAEQTIEVEVRAAAQAAETARLRVLAARVARQNAEVQVEGEKRLYTVGRSSTFLLFQRENQAAAARSLELRVLTDYNKALVDIQRVTSTTLRVNNVIID